MLDPREEIGGLPPAFTRVRIKALEQPGEVLLVRLEEGDSSGAENESVTLFVPAAVVRDDEPVGERLQREAHVERRAVVSLDGAPPSNQPQRAVSDAHLSRHLVAGEVLGLDILEQTLCRLRHCPLRHRRRLKHDPKRALALGPPASRVHLRGGHRDHRGEAPVVGAPHEHHPLAHEGFCGGVVLRGRLLLEAWIGARVPAENGLQRNAHLVLREPLLDRPVSPADHPLADTHMDKNGGVPDLETLLGEHPRLEVLALLVPVLKVKVRVRFEARCPDLTRRVRHSTHSGFLEQWPSHVAAFAQHHGGHLLARDGPIFHRGEREDEAVAFAGHVEDVDADCCQPTQDLQCPQARKPHGGEGPRLGPLHQLGHEPGHAVWEGRRRRRGQSPTLGDRNGAEVVRQRALAVGRLP